MCVGLRVFDWCLYSIFIRHCNLTSIFGERFASLCNQRLCSLVTLAVRLSSCSPSLTSVYWNYTNIFILFHHMLVQTYPSVFMVCRSDFHNSCRWNPSFWINFYWNVLRIHRFLVIQVLLCLWLHAFSIFNIKYGNGLHHNCIGLFRLKCWKLSLAMDSVPVCWFDSRICLLIFRILFFLQDSNEWFAAGLLLLRLHVSKSCGSMFFCTLHFAS